MHEVIDSKLLSLGIGELQISFFWMGLKIILEFIYVVGVCVICADRNQLDIVELWGDFLASFKGVGVYFRGKGSGGCW